MKDMGHLEGGAIRAPVHRTHFLKKMGGKKKQISQSEKIVQNLRRAAQGCG